MDLNSPWGSYYLCDVINVVAEFMVDAVDLNSSWGSYHLTPPDPGDPNGGILHGMAHDSARKRSPGGHSNAQKPDSL